MRFEGNESKEKKGRDKRGEREGGEFRKRNPNQNQTKTTPLNITSPSVLVLFF